MNDPDMRTKRYHQMAKDYQEQEWEYDKLQKRKELDELEREATDHSLGILAELNQRYLDKDDHVSFIYRHRHELKPKHLLCHLRFVNHRNSELEKIELDQLKQPAVGAYSILFKNRAAHQLADLLAPVFSTQIGC